MEPQKLPGEVVKEGVQGSGAGTCRSPTWHSHTPRSKSSAGRGQAPVGRRGQMDQVTSRLREHPSGRDLDPAPCTHRGIPVLKIHPNSFRRHPASPLGLQPPLKAPPSPSLLGPGRPGERMAAPPAGPCILKQSRKIIVSSPHDIAGECGLHHKALSCCAAPSPAVPAAHLQPRRGSRAGSRPMGHPCASPPWATRPRASPRRATSSRVVTRGEKERIHFLFLFLFFFFSPQRA